MEVAFWNKLRARLPISVIASSGVAMAGECVPITIIFLAFAACLSMDWLCIPVVTIASRFGNLSNKSAVIGVRSRMMPII